MADRKALVIESDFTDKIKLCKSDLGSKIKYRKHAIIVLEDLGTKIKFIVENN